MKHYLLVLVLLGLLSSGCAGSSVPETPQGLMPIRLPMGYIPNVQYAPFYVAVERGYFREAGFEVTFDYSFETDGMALVGANELSFTLASAEQVPLARAKGLPVVYVLAWWRDFPVGIAALPEAQIHSPADLAGKRVGVPVLAGASYVGLQALLTAGEVDESDITLETIGFNQVEAIISRQVDAAVIYANNEPVQLRERGYPVDVLRVADYLPLSSNGLVTNETVLAENPELVRRFIQPVLRGLADTLADPDAAFEISKKYVEGLDQNAEIQRKVLDETIKFWQADRHGYSDPQMWENMQQVLLSMGLLQEPLEPIDKAFTNAFIEP